MARRGDRTGSRAIPIARRLPPGCVAAWLGALLVACTPAVPSGQFKCDARLASSSAQCPPGWTCLDPRGLGARCFELRCGNGVAEPGELCDGGDLGGHGCQPDGYPGGTARCSGDCQQVEHGGCTGFCGEGAGVVGAPCCPDATCPRGLLCVAGRCAYDVTHQGWTCTQDGDCPAAVCATLPDGRQACSSACAGSSDCLGGWRCDADSRLCTCAASSEVCDGQDNDCNGIVDDPAPTTADCTRQTGLPSSCVNGECVCNQGLTKCGARCVDGQADAAHCGTCDRACPMDAVCQQGKCVCRPPETLCGDSCLDLRSDPINCGRCGRVCMGAARCSKGSCDPFAAPVNIPVTGPSSIAVVDLDGDQRRDLVVGSDFPPSVIVLLNQGQGAFGPARSYPTRGTGAGCVAAVADLDGDGKLDVATANYYYGGTPDGLSVLLGNGDGSLRKHVDYDARHFLLDTPHDPVYVDWDILGVAIGDFNNDNRPDLLSTGGGWSTLLGNGDGTFQKAVIPSEEKRVIAAVTGDLDGDHHLDVVLADVGALKVRVMLGRGDGTFIEKASYAVGSGPEPRVALELKDLDGDQRLDLAFTNCLDSKLSILVGLGDGTFQPKGTYPTGDSPLSAGLGVVALVIDDFDGDQNLDIATANDDPNLMGGNFVSLFRGSGDGTFRAAGRVTARDRPFRIASGDVDGDGKPDLVAANVKNGTVSVFLNRL